MRHWNGAADSCAWPWRSKASSRNNLCIRPKHHLAPLRCSSLTYSRYARSSRLAGASAVSPSVRIVYFLTTPKREYPGGGEVKKPRATDVAESSDEGEVVDLPRRAHHFDGKTLFLEFANHLSQFSLLRLSNKYGPEPELVFRTSVSWKSECCSEITCCTMAGRLKLKVENWLNGKPVSSTAPI